MFSVWDHTAEIWMDPFVAHTSKQAAQWFMDSTQDKSTNLGRHPESFTLFEVGEFDTDNGCVTGHSAPEPIVNGLVGMPEQHEEEESVRRIG